MRFVKQQLLPERVGRYLVVTCIHVQAQQLWNWQRKKKKRPEAKPANIWAHGWLTTGRSGRMRLGQGRKRVSNGGSEVCGAKKETRSYTRSWGCRLIDHRLILLLVNKPWRTSDHSITVLYGVEKRGNLDKLPHGLFSLFSVKSLLHDMSLQCPYKKTVTVNRSLLLHEDLQSFLCIHGI